jgi:hypothetical protein
LSLRFTMIGHIDISEKRIGSLFLAAALMLAENPSGRRVRGLPRCWYAGLRDLEFNKSTNSPLITRYIDRPFFDPCYSGNHFF